MGEELRWALVGAGGVFLAALAWWELRRPRHSRKEPGDGVQETGRYADPRLSLGEAEPALEVPTLRAADEHRAPEHRAAEAPGADPPVVVVDPNRAAPGAVDIDIADEFAVDEPGQRREPRLDDTSFASVDAEDGEPQLTDASNAYDITGELEPVSAGEDDAPLADAAVPAPAAAAPAPQPVRRSPPEPRWPPESERTIVSLRLVPRPPARFNGRSLRLAFEASGLEFGAYDIFHLANEAGDVLASAANLMRPGTFAPDAMDSLHYHGVHLFCVLPGPLPAGRAVDELVALARDLAQRVNGIVLDEVGRPLDEERAAGVREAALAAVAERGG